MRPEGSTKRVDNKGPAVGVALHQTLLTTQGPAHVNRQSRLAVRQESQALQARAAGVRELRVNSHRRHQNYNNNINHNKYCIAFKVNINLRCVVAFVRVSLTIRFA